MKQESREYAEKLSHADSHCDIRIGVLVTNLFINPKEKRSFFKNSLASLGLQTI